MARIRADFVFGTTDTALTATSTTVSSPALSRLPAVASPDSAAFILYDNAAGAYEIATITAHAAGATTATVTRGQEGSTAQSWSSGATWQHGPTVVDFAGSGGTRTLLKKVSLSAAAANIAFVSTDIPTSGFDHLELMILGRSAAAAAGDSVNIAINGDTSAANYKEQRFYGASAAAGASTGAINRLGFVDAGSDPAGAAGFLMATFPDYLGSWQKMIQPRGGKTGDPLIELSMLRWLNTASITSITLTCAGGNWAAGSKAWLYGLT